MKGWVAARRGIPSKGHSIQEMVEVRKIGHLVCCYEDYTSFLYTFRDVPEIAFTRMTEKEALGWIEKKSHRNWRVRPLMAGAIVSAIFRVRGMKSPLRSHSCRLSQTSRLEQP
jgi:hypothetical protein